MSKSAGVVYPSGFRAAGVSCGIKASGALDLGIILSEVPCSAAGLFTTNKVQAAPVQVSRERLKKGRAQAVVVNSGNANACTGERGITDALTMVNLAASLLKIPSELVCVASTGIIGHHLPMEKISKGIREAVGKLSRDRAAASNIARAIMTTDTRPKSSATAFNLGGKRVKIGAICKGAGMIAPRMATFLCFITSDVAITPAALRRALKDAVAETFNAMTVDGHTSTNDTVICLANGLAENPNISSGKNLNAFRDALTDVCRELAVSVVKDGEGATKLIKIIVTGAASDSDARKIAREIAESPLVKTAIFGGDPNWGRIISAAGYADAEFDQGSAVLLINGQTIFRRGAPVALKRSVLNKLLKGREVEIVLQCNIGKGKATFYTCDLTHDYITINAEYHT